MVGASMETGGYRGRDLRSFRGMPLKESLRDLSRTLERREKDRKGLQRPARPPARARSSRGLPGPPPDPGPPEAFPADLTRPRSSRGLPSRPHQTQVLQRPARPLTRPRSSRGLPSRPHQTQVLQRPSQPTPPDPGPSPSVAEGEEDIIIGLTQICNFIRSESNA
ncbi:unnamed protein product [Boreogadus saida]